MSRLGAPADCGRSPRPLPRAAPRGASVAVALLASALAFAPAAGAQESPSAAPAPVQAKKRKPRVLPGLAVELKTADGWTLAAQYSPAQPGKPTFVLLHETGGRKENWYYLVKEMAKRGIGALALDLRGHAASQHAPPGSESNWRRFRTDRDVNDWMNMSRDVDAAVDYLKGQGVPEASIALGGADVGSSIALRYAAVHKEVPMLFMLSPGFSYREVTTVNAVRMYGKRPILMVAGADDKRCMAEMPILFQFALNTAGAENARRIDAAKEHGTRLLVANRGLVSQIADWMEHPQAPPPPTITSSTEAPTEGAPGGGLAPDATAPVEPPPATETPDTEAPAPAPNP